MSEKRPGEIRRAPRGVFRAALLCASAAALTLPVIAFAQETGSLLRGEVSEAEINKDLLSRVPLQDEKSPLEVASPSEAQQQEGIPTPAYRPSSPGATPDPEPSDTSTPDSIFADQSSDDGGSPRGSAQEGE